MKPLIKLMLIIAGMFAATFLIVKFTGLLTIEQIEAWLVAARSLSPLYVGSIVALLLFADLFVAVPTLTVTVLSGFFLGHALGAAAALSGLMLAGISGYWLSRFFGDALLSFLIRDPDKIEEIRTAFNHHGFVMILLSRAVPILPEVTACLAGMTRMKFIRFLLAWTVSSVPYAAVAAYAGAISSIDNPTPGILIAIGISCFLWLMWFTYHRNQKSAD